MARLQRTVGTTFDAEIKMYEGVKYTSERGERITHEYKGIKFWEIVTDEDAEAGRLRHYPRACHMVSTHGQQRQGGCPMDGPRT